MGCSPSKGQKLFASAADLHSPLPTVPESDQSALKPREGEGEQGREAETPGLGSHERAAKLPILAEEKEPSGPTEATLANPSPVIDPNPDFVPMVSVTMKSPERDTQGRRSAAEEKETKRTNEVERRRRQMKAGQQGGRLGGGVEGKSFSVTRATKADVYLPPARVAKAHQAAYAYLNPNISKYETLLGLLEEVAQMELALRPAITLVALRFEEVSQALEEMAEDGESMLREHGPHMTWPSGRGPRVLPPAKAAPNSSSSSVSPPDLLQHMLRQEAGKMRRVGGLVHGLGDATLEKAAGYFASLSELLGERLREMRAAEGRLSRVLACVEAGAGAGMVVAASRKPAPEDSSLYSEDSGIGGENESLSGSDRIARHRGSAGSGGSVYTTPHCPPNQVCLNEGEEEQEEEEEEEEEDEYEEDEEEEEEEKEEGETSRPQHSPSTGVLEALPELQSNQTDQDERFQKMAGLSEAGLSSHLPGPLKTPSSLLPLPPPQPPSCRSVRRLINTFSRGADALPHIRESRVPPLPDIWGGGEPGGLCDNGDNGNNNGWYSEDADSLPPPPPEVLMDSSFHSTGDMPREEEEGRGRLTMCQRTGISQRLRASVRNVAVLPNRGTVHSLGVAPQAEQSLEGDVNSEKEQADTLYGQARKIIHLRNAVETPVVGVGPKAAAGLRMGNEDYGEAESHVCSYRPTTPPVSRVHLPPLCSSGPPSGHPCPPSQRRFSSRPGSPRFQRWTRENSNEENGSALPPTASISFRDARAVFCQERPRPQTSLRRIQSDRRPGTSTPAEDTTTPMEANPAAPTAQTG